MLPDGWRTSAFAACFGLGYAGASFLARLMTFGGRLIGFSVYTPVCAVMGRGRKGHDLVLGQRTARDAPHTSRRGCI